MRSTDSTRVLLTLRCKTMNNLISCRVLSWFICTSWFFNLNLTDNPLVYSRSIFNLFLRERLYFWGSLSILFTFPFWQSFIVINILFIVLLLAVTAQVSKHYFMRIRIYWSQVLSFNLLSDIWLRYLWIIVLLKVNYSSILLISKEPIWLRSISGIKRVCLSRI